MSDSHSFSPISDSNSCASALITVSGVLSSWLAEVTNSFCLCRFFTSGETTLPDTAAKTAVVSAMPMPEIASRDAVPVRNDSNAAARDRKVTVMPFVLR